MSEKRSVRFRRAADRDIIEAATWYETGRAELARDFKESVRECFEQVRANPLRFPLVLQKIRRAMLRRFPYGVFYTGADPVVVLAVAHLSRHPRRWLRRL